MYTSTWELQNVKERDSYHENIVIMGDLSGHVLWEQQGIKNAIAAFSLGKKNPVGKSIIDFCVSNSMSVMNTFYKQSESHK